MLEFVLVNIDFFACLPVFVLFELVFDIFVSDGTGESLNYLCCIAHFFNAGPLAAAANENCTILGNAFCHRSEWVTNLLFLLYNWSLLDLVGLFRVRVGRVLLDEDAELLGLHKLNLRLLSLLLLFLRLLLEECIGTMLFSRLEDIHGFLHGCYLLLLH